MAIVPVAANIQELRERFSQREIIAMVHERHPKGELAKKSPFEFFAYTHLEVYGATTCAFTQTRVLKEYIESLNSSEFPDYFVRCLLPGYRGSA